LRFWSPDEFRDLLDKEASELGAVYACHRFRHLLDVEPDVCAW